MALILRPPTERESLTDRLADLGRARKRVAVAAGLFAFVAISVGLATLAGFLDAAIHISPVYRAFALVILLTTSGVVWLRGVVRPLRYRTDALAVAIELENQFPTFNDSLASAVSFLGPSPEEEDDDRPPSPTGVSNRLLASAVRLAERKAGRLPLDNFVPTGRCWQAAWLCVGVLAVSLPLMLWNLGRADIAFARLSNPFGSTNWPTKTRIDILAPEFPARIARGETFELKFTVRGVLSGPATVRVRVHGGAEFEEHFPLAINNDPQYPNAAVVTARFDPARVPSNFSVRVTSNDADTDWREATVVPPPRLVPLDGRPSPQFHATPPEYTGLSPTQLPDGAAVIEIPTGTLIRFRAATDVRVSTAELIFSGDKSFVINAAPVAYLGHLNPLSAIACQELAEQLGANIPLTISEDRTRITAEFIPPLSGLYALKLTDETGLTGTQHLEIRLTVDPVPAVILARPTASIDPPLLAPTASVVLNTLAEDKLYGVRRSFIEYRVGRAGPMRVLPLTERPNISASALAAITGWQGATAIPQSGIVEVNRVIPVRAFLRDDGTPLHEGDILIIRAAADDWDDVAPLKGPGRSATEFEIRIASPEAIEAWLQKELATFRPELIRIRDQQRDAKQKVADVIVLPGGVVSSPDRDRLITAEQVQRQLRAKVADPRDGLRAKADLLRATVLANKLPKSNTTERVEIVALELGRMADRELGTVEQNLAEARQLVGQPPKPDQEQQLNSFLLKTGRSQKNIEDAATALLDLLSQWGGAGEIRGEARVLRDAILRQIAINEHLKDRVPEGKLQPSDDEQRELARAAAKAEQSAEQAGQLIARAARLATEKDKQAADLRTQATAKEKDATALRLQAAETNNPVEKSSLNAKADALAASATDLKLAADKAAAEAAALRKGLNAAGGQGLADDLRKAAELLRKNQQSAAAAIQQSAVSRLDALGAALAENEQDAVPELAKPKSLKNAADQLNQLADAQDELRKKAEAANRIQDPDKRKAALKELAKEQDLLIERGRELLQKLTRERADDAARDARAALDKMEAARDDLENGRSPGRAQAEAVDKLDGARDRLDVASAQAGRQLSDEKRRKLADMVKSLLERQKAAVGEATRIHGDVARMKGWDKLLLTSYSDLDTVREQEIAIEIRKLAEKEFAPLPVFARLLNDAAKAIDTAREKIKTRCDDADLGAAFDPELEAANDRKVMRPMTLALRRLEQLAEALKPDDPKKPAEKSNGNPPNQPQNPPQPNPDGGGEQDIVPPLAQLKVLRALQAELNKRTADFAKDHPNPDKLTDEEKAELRELEQSQLEIAELFEKMAALFQKKDMPSPEEGKKEKGKNEEPK